MLVLRRRVDETIRIADNISIRILEVQGDSVQVGVEAPRHIPVTRVEKGSPHSRQGKGGPTEKAGG